MEKAILAGPCIGEMYWEFGRFAPHVLWKKKKYGKGIKLITLTRPDRFDIYGQHSEVLVSLRLDDKEVKGNCFGMIGYNRSLYNSLIKRFRKQYSKRFEVIDHIYPNLEKGQTCNRNQYSKKQMEFDYLPRIENKQIVDNYIKDDKKIVVITPRYRQGFKRNWKHWQTIYDMIYNDEKLMTKFNFTICGKKPDYVPDKKERFLDINNFSLNEQSSLIGILIEVIKRSYFTVGSQSAIPNISLLFGIPVLEWGDQRSLHTKTYNIRNTPVTFLDDKNFNIKPKIVFNELKTKLLKGEKK